MTYEVVKKMSTHDEKYPQHKKNHRCIEVDTSQLDQPANQITSPEMGGYSKTYPTYGIWYVR
jgi:DUF917 family protein